MFRIATTCSLAVAAMMLCAGAAMAQAQVAPVRYWIPGGPFGFGSGVSQSWQSMNWGDVPGFATAPGDDGERTGLAFRSYSVPVSSFSNALNVGGIGGAGAFGNFSTLAAEGAQYGYSFKGVGGLPVTLFSGVDTLKYNPDVFGQVTSFSGAGTTAATTIHAGVEIRPTSNLSLSFSAGYTQRSGLADSDIRSTLLPGESPLFSGGRR